jgi:hypothetical protein
MLLHLVIKFKYPYSTAGTHCTYTHCYYNFIFLWSQWYIIIIFFNLKRVVLAPIIISVQLLG